MPAVEQHYSLSFKIFVILTSTVLSLLALEAVSRWVFPINPGSQNLALDGTPFRFDQRGSHLPRGVVYMQASDEFQARTTTTSAGHRGPAHPAPPEVLFLGDSFTYGQGLSDDETFVAQFCGQLKISCANLGRPSSGYTTAIRNPGVVVSRAKLASSAPLPDHVRER
jgi:hypothetical protein